LNASFSGSHGAGWEPQGQIGTLYAFNNIIHNSPEVAIMVGGEAGPASGPAYIWNNITYSNSGKGILLSWQPAGNNTAYIYNNVIDVSDTPDYAILSEGGTWSGIAAENNFVISQTSFNITATNSFVTSNLFMTTNAFYADGYSISNLYQSPSNSSPTVASGRNLSVLGIFTNDIFGNPRPTNGPWDIGPYQFKTNLPPIKGLRFVDPPHAHNNVPRVQKPAVSRLFASIPPTQPKRLCSLVPPDLFSIKMPTEPSLQ
jgi:hypothetical protein